jgi:hypothetical protein
LPEIGEDFGFRGPRQAYREFVSSVQSIIPQFPDALSYRRLPLAQAMGKTSIVAAHNVFGLCKLCMASPAKMAKPVIFIKLCYFKWLTIFYGVA